MVVVRLFFVDKSSTPPPQGVAVEGPVTLSVSGPRLVQVYSGTRQRKDIVHKDSTVITLLNLYLFFRFSFSLFGIDERLRGL